METIREKIAYLRGIIDGDPSIKDDRVRFLFERILLVLDDITDDLENVVMAQEELEDYVGEIDFDLANLEDDFYQDSEDKEFDKCFPEEPMIEMECPSCQEVVCFDEGFLYDDDVQITCPNCSTVIFDTREVDDLDFEDDEN
ncbi:MAG: AraC family transcriptional regulator [Firmicutes bacterium]|nr:AraC family transcriptional regulator [Bacillota bacterium]